MVSKSRKYEERGIMLEYKAVVSDHVIKNTLKTRKQEK